MVETNGLRNWRAEDGRHLLPDLETEERNKMAQCLPIANYEQTRIWTARSRSRNNLCHLVDSFLRPTTEVPTSTSVIFRVPKIQFPRILTFQSLY